MRNSKLFAVFSLFICSFIISCSDLLEPRDNVLTIALPDNSARSIVSPSDVKYYDVEVFKGEEIEIPFISIQNKKPAATITIDNLKAGTYSVAVTAKDENKEILDQAYSECFSFPETSVVPIVFTVADDVIPLAVDWADLKSKVEALEDKTTETVIKLNGAYTADSTINVNGNVKLIGKESATITLGTDVTLFNIKNGATLTLGDDTEKNGLIFDGNNLETTKSAVIASGSLTLNKQFTMKNFVCNKEETPTIYIYGEESPVSFTMNGSTIMDCTNSVYPIINTISLDSSNNISITNASFIKNTIGNNGVICIDIGSEVEIQNTTFTSNTNTEGDGGAINIASTSDKSVTLNNCDFNGNKITGSNKTGGAISAGGTGNLTISNCEFRGNESENGGGGAIYVYRQGETTITDTTFNLNSCSKESFGGAIYAQLGKITLKDVIFTDNYRAKDDEEAETEDDIYTTNAKGSANPPVNCQFVLGKNITMNAIRFSGCNENRVPMILNDDFNATKNITLVMTSTSASAFTTGTSLFALNDDSEASLENFMEKFTLANEGYTLNTNGTITKN